MPNLILALLLTTSSIRITGAGTCPSPGAVEKHLVALVGEKGTPNWSAMLRETPDGLQVELAQADGSVVSRRVLPPLAPNAGRSCANLADIVALVLASWLSNLTSQAVDTPSPPPVTPSPPPPSPSLRPAVTETLPPAHRERVGVRENLPSKTSSPPAGERPGEGASRPTPPWSFELGLAVTGSFTGSALAPGGLLQLEAGPARARWALRASGAYDGPRQAPEGSGAVSWQRFQGGLGASYQLLRGTYDLEAGGDVILSDLVLRGMGFRSDSSSTSLSPGVQIGARLALLRDHWHPWIGVWATLWTRQEVPSVQGLALQSALPQLEGFVGLGVSWRSVERF